MKLGFVLNSVVEPVITIIAGNNAILVSSEREMNSGDNFLFCEFGSDGGVLEFRNEFGGKSRTFLPPLTVWAFLQPDIGTVGMVFCFAVETKHFIKFLIIVVAVQLRFAKILLVVLVDISGVSAF